MKSWASAAIGITFGLAAACSSSSSNTGGAGGQGGYGGSITTSTSHSSSSHSSSSSSSSSTGTGGGSTACDAAQGQNCSACPATDTSTTCQNTPSLCVNCTTCCDNQNPTAYAALIKDLFNACACATGAPCNTPCSGTGDYCPGMTSTPSAGCISCIKNLADTEPCLTTTVTTCDNDSTCKPALTCVATCPQP